jgi:hypothetical protein
MMKIETESCWKVGNPCPEKIMLDDITPGEQPACRLTRVNKY